MLLTILALLLLLDGAVAVAAACGDVTLRDDGLDVVNAGNDIGTLCSIAALLAAAGLVTNGAPAAPRVAYTWITYHDATKSGMSDDVHNNVYRNGNISR